jgi:hypothetical protein
VLRPEAAGTTQGWTGGEGRLDAGHLGASDVPAKHQVTRAGRDEQRRGRRLPAMELDGGLPDGSWERMKTDSGQRE